MVQFNGTDIMSLTLTKSDAAKITLESPIKTANASSRKSAIRIVGNAFNNSIVGGKGKDTFFYTANEGTDRIYDWDSGDLLQILNADGSFKSSKFSGSALTLTINGGGKIIFDDVNSNTALVQSVKEKSLGKSSGLFN